MKRLLVRLVSLAGGAAGAIIAPSSQGAAQDNAAEHDDFACAVDLRVRDGIAAIRGVITSPHEAAGTYRLAVHKVGSAGTSNLSQGGAFTLEPGRRTGVGSVNLSVEAGARYEAVLTVEVGGARKECRASGEAELKL